MIYAEYFRSLITPKILKRCADELHGFQKKLVQMAENNQILDPTDQNNILLYLRDGRLPGHPRTVAEVIKNFASSASSYSIIRRRLGAHVGAIPTASSIAAALAAEFSDNRFLDDSFWKPAFMKFLALDVARINRLTAEQLGRKTPKSRILGFLHDGAQKMDIALSNGLKAYYKDIEKHLTGPECAWKMLEIFAAGIRQVGPPLCADFMKNIGFHMFVKPDIHFLQQFPKLSGLNKRLSPRDSFCLGWLLASELKINAFVLDHTLYQWGRHGDKGKTFSARRVKSIRTAVQRDQRTKRFSKVGGDNSNSEHLDYLLNIKFWQEEPKTLTVHRQKQLIKILSKYDGESIPITHFTKEHRRSSKLRNEDAYPAVKALMCSILERTADSLRLKKGIVLGEKDFP
ncbi:MAG TPA: hypothetical protein VLL97_13015 [Acidobacteriota bacterium]|nr:hypothetical protein [Acidobacteriota bacterium]